MINGLLPTQRELFHNVQCDFDTKLIDKHVEKFNQVHEGAKGQIKTMENQVRGQIEHLYQTMNGPLKKQEMDLKKIIDNFDE